MANILVVDDSAVDRRLIGGLLQQDAQHQVDYAEDVPSALFRLRDQRPDLVVTDLHMPGPSGLELVAAVRLDYPGVPVILVTGYGHDTLAAEALHHGAAGYVPKSLLHQRLLRSGEWHAVADAGRTKRMNGSSRVCAGASFVSGCRTSWP